MSDSAPTEFTTLAQTDEWVLVQPATQQIETVRSLLFLTWIAEHDMPDNLLEACQRLATKPPDWPGIQLNFDPQPQPGFVLTYQPGWMPTTEPQFQHQLEQVLWEIQRLNS